MYGMLKKVFGGALLAGLALGATAQAGIVVDIRDQLTQSNTLTVTPDMLNTTRTFEIWVTVTGTNGEQVYDDNLGDFRNQQGVQYITGSVVSQRLSGSQVGGDITLSARYSPFNATGSNNAGLNDINGDGDVDAAPPGGFSSTTVGYLFARSAGMEYTLPGDDGASLSYVTTKRLARVSYKITDVGPGTTNLNWVWQTTGSVGGPINSIAAAFVMDGVPYNLAPSGVTALPSGALTLTPMTLSVVPIPEPASLGLLGLAGLGLLARRRA